MKMFLTRIGFNSRAVITGDITQVDLPRGQKSGLRHAIEVLVDIPGVSFNFFQSKDVVRHPVVAHIVEAYDAWEQKENRLKVEKQQYREQQKAEPLSREGISESTDASSGKSSAESSGESTSEKKHGK